MTQLLIAEALQQYSEKYTTPETRELAALNRETNMKVPVAEMLSGHLQGAFFKMISGMIRPKHILEIGTFTGYSAICLAGGLQSGGSLDTIDINDELEEMAAKYFLQAGISEVVNQYFGQAAKVIPGLSKQYDLVFIDADKTNYGLYYDLVFDKVPVGGYILADNVLYNGEVVLPEAERSKNARAMYAFNEKIATDHRVENMLLPFRDGVMLIRKVAAE